MLNALTIKFDIKDLGPLHFFSGIQITENANRVFLLQTKYIQELLQKTKRSDSKSY